MNSAVHHHIFVIRKSDVEWEYCKFFINLVDSNQRLQSDTQGLGICISRGDIPRSPRRLRMFRRSTSSATLVFALSRSIWLSVLALTVLGAAETVSMVIRIALVQLRTPDEMRGRVGAVNFLFVNTRERGPDSKTADEELAGTAPNKAAMIVRYLVANRVPGQELRGCRLNAPSLSISDANSISRPAPPTRSAAGPKARATGASRNPRCCRPPTSGISRRPSRPRSAGRASASRA